MTNRDILRPVMLNDSKSFRGCVVRFRSQNALPWGRLAVSPGVCTMRTGLGRQFEVRRSETSFVRYEKIRFPPLVIQNVISFFDSQDRRLALYFVPSRPERVRRTLVEYGRPLRVERLGFRGRRPGSETDPSGASH